MQGKAVLSSLPLQIFLYLNAYYLVFFMVAEILLFVYKTEILPYPSAGKLALDLILLFLLAGVEILRIFIASKGNLTEHTGATVLALGLICGSVVLVIYFLLWQVYVLRADTILCSILLGIQGVELLFAFISACTFSRAAAV